MESIESFEYLFTIANIISSIVHIIILIAAIIMVIREKSGATYTFLAGSILSILGIVVRFVYRTAQSLNLVSFDDTLKSESIFSIFATLSFLVLGVGLLLIALNSFKNIKS
ncbi:MAG: hypothetical protein ACK5NB_01865 [Flavobacteriaceae bacterium]